MATPDEAYGKGYEKGRKEGLAGNTAEAIFGMMKDDPGGHHAAGYRDGAAGKEFKPPSAQAPVRKPAADVNPFDDKVAIKAVCPHCGALDWLEWKFLGRLTDPFCGHSWCAGSGTYAAMQIRAAFAAGGKGAKYMTSGVSGGEGAWIAKGMGWFMGVLLGLGIRLEFGVLMIPIQAFAGLFQTKKTTADLVTRLVVLAITLGGLGILIYEVQHAPSPRWNWSPQAAVLQPPASQANTTNLAPTTQPPAVETPTYLAAAEPPNGMVSATADTPAQTSSAAIPPPIAVVPEPAPIANPQAQTPQENGRRLIDRALNAVGGLQAIAGIKDSTTVVDAVLYPAMTRIRILTTFVAPGYIRQESQLPNGTSVLYTDGQSGWISMPQQGVNPLTSKQILDLTFYDLGKLVRANVFPSWTVFGISQDMVQVSSGTGQSATLQCDERTGLPLRMLYQVPGQSGELIDAETTLSDWRQVDGFTVPFRATTMANGKKGRQQVTLEVKFNTGIDAALLSRRP
jgi:hypothetical protein